RCLVAQPFRRRTAELGVQIAQSEAASLSWRQGEHRMSQFVRSLVIVPLFTAVAISTAPASAAQIGAVKDGWLVMKVHSEMVDEEVLSGSNIDGDGKNDVVTLKGTVPSEAGRARALEVARKNDGVKNVVDHLTIAPARGTNMAGKVD